MKNLFLITFTAIIFLLPALQHESVLYGSNEKTVKGVVFYDRNHNGVFDQSKDKPLKGVAVSNGRDVVLDNIRWIVEEDKSYYRTGLGDDQMEFLRNELERLYIPAYPFRIFAISFTIMLSQKLFFF